MVKKEEEFKGYFMTGLKLILLYMVVSIANIFVLILAAVLIAPTAILGVFGPLFAILLVIATLVASITLAGWLAKKLWGWD